MSFRVILRDQPVARDHRFVPRPRGRIHPFNAQLAQALRRNGANSRNIIGRLSRNGAPNPSITSLHNTLRASVHILGQRNLDLCAPFDLRPDPPQETNAARYIETYGYLFAVRFLKERFEPHPVSRETVVRVEFNLGALNRIEPQFITERVFPFLSLADKNTVVDFALEVALREIT